MKKPPEIIPADQSIKLNFYIFIAAYILLLLLLEPVIDYFLLFDVKDSNLMLINKADQMKMAITPIAYGMLRMFPLLLAAWFGYRILSSAQLPPARMRLPFAVPLQRGRSAKVLGLSIISLSLLFVAQNIVYVTRQITS